jgi:Class III cytochrome C family
MHRDKKNIAKIACSLAFIVLAIVSFWSQQSKVSAKPKQELPKLMILDDPDKKKTEFAGDKGKTPFDHDQHIAYSSWQPQDKCVVCHHTNTNKLTEAIEEEVLKCGVCHKLEETTCEIEGTNEDKKFKGLKSINSEEAFHGKDSLIGCIGCHKERSKEPVGCKECHNGEDTIEYKYKKK